MARAYSALRPGGSVVLEPQRFATVQATGEGVPSWYSAPSGLFSSRPHLCLTESSWDEALRSATQRFWVVDTETAAVTRYALTTEAYLDEEFVGLLEGAGFTDVRLLPSLIGAPDESQSFNLAVVGTKPGEARSAPGSGGARS